MYKHKPLIILILLLLLIKFGILLSLSNTAMIINDDELFYGGIAKEILNGHILPLFDYQVRPWEGGGLIVSIIASFCFFLFGDSLFSLKLVGIFFSLAILVVLYLFLYKYISRKVAILSSLLFILSPPVFTQRSLMVFGNHFEAIFFSFLTISIFYRIFFKKIDNKDAVKYFCLFGLINGFATYFCYTFLVTLFTCIIFWFIFDRRFLLRKQFFIFILSFAVGFTPWIYYNLTHQFSGIIIKNKTIFNHFFNLSLSRILTRLKSFIFDDLLHALGFENFGTGSNTFVSFGYYSIFFASFVYLIWSNRESIRKLMAGLIFIKRIDILPKEILKEVFFLVYFALFSSLYIISDFVFDDIRLFKNYKHIIPILPFMIIIISLFLNKLYCRTNKYLHRVSLFLAAALIVIGLFYNIYLISFINFGNIFKYKGYSYTKFGYTLGMKFNGTNLKDIIDLIDRFHGVEYKSDCYYGLGMKLGELYGLEGGKAIEIIETFNEEYKAYCYYGLGEQISKKVRDLSTAKNTFPIVRQITKRYQKYFVEGLGTGMYWLVSPMLNINEINSLLEYNFSGDYVKYLYRGVTTGYDGGLPYDLYINFINRLPEHYRPYAYEGLGIGIGDTFLFDDAKTAFKLINALDRRYRLYTYQGLGIEIANVVRDDINKCMDLINKAEDDYRLDCQRGLLMVITGKRLCRLGFKTELLIF